MLVEALSSSSLRKVSLLVIGCNTLQWVKEDIQNKKGLKAFSLTASKALLYSASFSWLKMQYFAKKSTANRREEDKDQPLELVECI